MGDIKLTQAQLDSIIAAINNRMQNSQAQAALALKADKSTTYSKTEVDAAMAGKENTMANATASTAGKMSAADKSKLDGIAVGANNYTLPTATASVLGGVKVSLSGTTLTITA